MNDMIAPFDLLNHIIDYRVSIKQHEEISLKAKC